jgi:hypothetical protein
MISRRTTPRKKALWTTLPGAKVDEPKERKRMNKIRPEPAALKRRYNARVKVWLTEPEYQWCACCIARGERPIRRATNNHHKNGRGWRGELTMVESLWIPCCSECHPSWIDSHRDEARALGLLAPKGQWNKWNRMPDEKETQ